MRSLAVCLALFPSMALAQSIPCPLTSLCLSPAGMRAICESMGGGSGGPCAPSEPASLPPSAIELPSIETLASEIAGHWRGSTRHDAPWQRDLQIWAVGYVHAALAEAGNRLGQSFEGDTSALGEFWSRFEGDRGWTQEGLTFVLNDPELSEFAAPAQDWYRAGVVYAARRFMVEKMSVLRVGRRADVGGGQGGGRDLYYLTSTRGDVARTLRHLDIRDQDVLAAFYESRPLPPLAQSMSVAELVPCETRACRKERRRAEKRGRARISLWNRIQAVALAASAAGLDTALIGTIDHDKTREDAERAVAVAKLAAQVAAIMRDARSAGVPASDVSESLQWVAQ